MQNKSVKQVDVVMIGGGIMSATLATILHEINPDLRITIYEKLSKCGQESSDVLNNAGTGHAGNCELNYTPKKNGTIDESKAVEISEMYELSLQLWSFITKSENINPKKFITKSPHASFVWNKSDVAFLKERYERLKIQPLFKNMTFLESAKMIEKKFPLLIKGRKKLKHVALTYYENGTDVNFGALTQLMIKRLKKNKNFKVLQNTEVHKVTNKNKKYQIFSHKPEIESDFIFLGAGGNTIKILQQLKIKESKGYAAFPISGRWLICNKSNVINNHQGKVYSQAETGSPPMSVPHLDIRKINGKDCLLFGPFAGFTFKFLKSGSLLDFPRSIKFSNLKEIITVFFKNLNLLKYLIQQVLMTHSSRMKHLKKFYPFASEKDWRLINAGQRVQIIKPSSRFSGKLEFGTEIIYKKDKSLAALLGASPGASVSASSMLDIVENCFIAKNSKSKSKLKKIFPSYGIRLNQNPSLLKKIRDQYQKILKLR